MCLDEVPIADELLAEETKRDVPLGAHRLFLIRRDRLVGAAVPDEDVTGAVLAARDAPLEAVVLHRMIFRLDRQPLHLGVVARSFGHGPTRHRSGDLETKIVVHSRRVVLLDDELEPRTWIRLAFFLSLPESKRRRCGLRLGRDGKVALRAIRRERVPRLRALTGPAGRTCSGCL